MKKKFKFLLCMVAIVGLVLTGCGAENDKNAESHAADQNQEASGEQSKDGKYKIGLAMNTQTNPFFVDVKDGVEKAAKERGVELYVTDAQDDPTIQQKNVEDMITKKPDAIIIDPCDSDAIISSVEACNKANIPVITMDRESNGGEVVAHIGYDAIKSGKMAGEYLVEQLNGKGKIVELQGIMGTNVAQNRSKGFNEVIKANPGMEIVAVSVADFDRAKAMSVTENILQANPEIDGLYAANDEMLLGAVEAMDAANRTDKIVKIGCDAIDDTLEEIRDGRVQATIAEPPFFLGKAILNASVDYLDGKKIDKHVILENQLVTKDNVDTIVTKEK